VNFIAREPHVPREIAVDPPRHRVGAVRTLARFKITFGSNSRRIDDAEKLHRSIFLGPSDAINSSLLLPMALFLPCEIASRRGSPVSVFLRASDWRVNGARARARAARLSITMPRAEDAREVKGRRVLLRSYEPQVSPIRSAQHRRAGYGGKGRGRGGARWLRWMAQVSNADAFSPFPAPEMLSVVDGASTCARVSRSERPGLRPALDLLRAPSNDQLLCFAKGREGLTD